MNEYEPTRQDATPLPDADAENERDTEAEPRAGPRIYAASLGDYNNGILHGSWLDAAVEPEELHAGIARMLAESPTAKRFGEPAEEWAIHDFDGFGSSRLGEYEPVERITAIAQGIAEHGPAFAAWTASNDGDPATPERFLDAYLGEWDTVEAYAASLLDDIGMDDALDKAVPEGLRPYVKIDAEGFARDLEYGGDIVSVENPEGGVWIFDER